jgi:hypothetical protein
MTTNHEPTEPEAELRRIVRMLDKTAKLAEHATLTGSLSNGKSYAIRSYNAVVEHLASTTEIPPALFPLLSESASLGDVGIASAQLAEYLRAALPEQQDNLLFKGFFTKGELGEIADLAREHVLDQVRRRFRERDRHGRAERHDPSPPPPAPPPPPPPGRPTGSTAGAPEPPVARLWQPPQGAGLEDLRPEQEGTAASSPSAADRRREILEALNAGRLTADEAAAQLEAL